MLDLTRRRAVLAGTATALSAPFLTPRRAAAERAITIGIYTGQQGDVVRNQLIPPFEAAHNCKVYVTQGVTLEQIALMRATRNNPKYTVMFVDDIGIELAKREGLIEKLPREHIPNADRVLSRFFYYDGFGIAYAMSAAGLAYNTATGQPIKSYEELWGPHLKGRFLMFSPTGTQSLYLLIAAAALQTGKPYAEAQYHIDQAWPKIQALKPNVLSMFTSETTVMQVAQGEADVAGLFYSKSVNPYTMKGAPVAMCYPQEGTFAGINCLSLVKNGPERELGLAFINHMLDPAMQKTLAEATLTAPSLGGLQFRPEVAQYMAYPEEKMAKLGIFSPDWTYINPIRPQLLERYNQLFRS